MFASFRPLLITAAFFVPLTGATNCQHFNDVTVPANDNGVPAAFSSILRGTQEIVASPIYQEYDQPVTFAAIGALVDVGGVQSMTMDSEAEVYCRSGSIGQLTYVNYGPLSDSQSGSVGSTVSNGIFLFRTVNLNDFDGYCRSGFTLRRVTYTWWFEGNDFAGNDTSAFGGTVVYEQ